MSGEESTEPGEVDLDADELEPLEPATALEELLEEVADGLGLDVAVDVQEGDGVLRGSLRGEDVGLFIGRRGQTIDAVQHLAQRIVFPEGPSPVRVVVDADGYRERRVETLQGDAEQAAEDALSSGLPVELEPMPASERRIVHEYLRERGGVETHSEGDEPERRLVVSPLGD
jgi:spoIIIJ-associated protein